MRERLKELFLTACELAPGARQQFVAGLDAGDAALRAELSRLLLAHEAAGAFLEHPSALVEAAATDADGGPAAHDDLEPGREFGVYRLVERLGSGGFGSVWRAHQSEPVDRDVALKVLFGGVDPERLLARFRAERQVLARMQHPGIAKVFDAGAGGGRCWLAMELVEGEPITRHCAADGLDPRERLRLFAEVCRAVQHAHGKGIVHRDLKPSNILVTRRDGRPAPVVIDFGVATARDDAAVHPVEDGEAAGGAGRPRAIGTPEYMSPEQAGLAGADVDTRTDVYALGVVLYELLCGRRPFDRREDEATPALLRRIREEAHAPPGSLRGRDRRLPWREVDRLLQRALQKQPADRYPTAAAFADDIERLLRHEPLQAGPPGAAYRLQRFARRNRLLVLGVAITIASLAAGTLLALLGLREARAAAEQARLDQRAAERATERALAAEAGARADQRAAERASRTANRALLLFDELWNSVDRARFGRADYPVRELFLDFERELPHHAAGEPEVELRVRGMLGRLQRGLGMLPGALDHLERAVALARGMGDPQALGPALLELARARFDAGRYASAEESAREALALAEQHGPPAARADALQTVADCRQRLDDRDGAQALAEQALALRRERQEPEEVAASLLQLANLHGSAGRAELAMDLLEEALQLLAPLGEHHSDALTALQHRAFLEQRLGRAEAAEATFRESLRRRRVAYGQDHPQVAWAEADLGWLLRERGRPAEAVPLLRAALDKLRARLGEHHLLVTEATQRLGATLVELREFAEAQELLERAADRYRTLPDHPAEGLAGCLGNLASLLWHSGDRQGGLVRQRQSLELAQRELPEDHYVVSVSLTNTAWMLAELGELDEAFALLRAAHEKATASGRHGEARIQERQLRALERRMQERDAGR